MEENLKCILCGFENQEEIVSHINFKHEGGLMRYLMFFPSAKVVGPELMAQLQKSKEDVTRISLPKYLSEEDAQAIINAWRAGQPQRSSIIVEESINEHN